MFLSTARREGCKACCTYLTARTSQPSPRSLHIWPRSWLSTCSHMHHRRSRNQAEAAIVLVDRPRSKLRLFIHHLPVPDACHFDRTRSRNGNGNVLPVELGKGNGSASVKVPLVHNEHRHCSILRLGPDLDAALLHMALAILLVIHFLAVLRFLQ